jgi:hypothetical protein
MSTGSIHSVHRVTLAAAAFAFALAATPAFAADPAPSEPPKSKVVSFEPIAGSNLKRITLSAKAAERLDIQVGKVSQEVVVRKQMVSGMVLYPQQAAPSKGAPAAVGGFGSPATNSLGSGAGSAIKTIATRQSAVAATTLPAGGQSVVLVNLSQGEFDRIAKDRPARVLPLYTRDKDVKEMTAMLSDAAPVEDARRSMLGLHYVLPSSDHGLAPSTRMRVELQLAGSEEPQKIVPYSAVYYDTKGVPWVYVNTKPLTYERQRISVKRVVGNLAVLSDGPAVGTPVVTVGASMLFGTEIYGK